MKINNLLYERNNLEREFQKCLENNNITRAINILNILLAKEQEILKALKEFKNLHH